MSESARAERLQAGAVILAAGARETVVPFPGWTLPGVMTVGAAQLLAKRHGVVPLPTGVSPFGSERHPERSGTQSKDASRSQTETCRLPASSGPSGNRSDAARPRVLLAGSGLLLLPAAARLAELGAHVIGVLETARLGVASLGKVGGPGSIVSLAPSLWARRDEAWHYLSALRAHRIPYHFGRAVLGARASAAGYLEAVDVVRLDGSGSPTPGSAETWPVDLLCVGHGLVPNVELAQLAGADVIYDAELGGWAVNVDARSRVRTSIPGLFVAGESAGISGAGAALLSGRVAAMSAAVQLGRLPEAVLQAELTRTARERRRHVRFGAAANLFFGVPDALYRAIPDDTPVCRCEEVTAGQVRAAISAAGVGPGAMSLDGLKPATRVGQGLCQGRTCGPILSRMLAASTGTPPEAAGLFRARPPVKPVPLAGIAGLLRPEGAPLQEERLL